MVDVEAIDSKVGQIGQTQNASGELDSRTELHTGIGYGLWFSDTVARSSRRRVADRFGSPTLRSAIESWAKQQDFVSSAKLFGIAVMSSGEAVKRLEKKS
jgi:hypothetical protein